MMQTIKTTRMSRRGFTMIELLVVIVVLAALAGIMLPRFMDAGQRSRETALHGDLKLLRTAIEAFRQDTGLFPLTLADLAATAAPAQGNDGTNDVNLDATKWHGPYLQAIFDDPVAADAFDYTKTTGVVASSAAGNGLDGTAYSTW